MNFSLVSFDAEQLFKDNSYNFIRPQYIFHQVMKN